MPERQVRFTEQFFDQLDRLLPGERGADGTPSVTDLLLLDLPRVRDRLAADYEGNTLPTDDPDIRVYVGAGVLVSRFAIFVALEADTVEAFLALDRSRGRQRRRLTGKSCTERSSLQALPIGCRRGLVAPPAADHPNRARPSYTEA